jgi:two-component system, LytTR family, sensor kinase
MMSLNRKSNLVIALVGGWWLFWALVQLAIMSYYGIGLYEALIDSLTTAIVLAMASYILVTIVKYFKLTPKNALTIFVATILLASLCTWLLGKKIIFLSSDEYYLNWVSSTQLIRFIFVWLMLIIASIDGWLFFYIKEHQQDELRIQESEQLARETELNGLRQQLQPHFLFNSLNSISSLTISQPEQARKMIEQLSDFLRGTVKKDGNQMLSLEEELHHLQLYLEIEKVRFGHRLNPKVNTDAQTLSMKLPSLLLQPIVENAIKFGLYDTVGEVTILINSKAESGNLVIQISNPFDPSTSVPKLGTGFGLKSVQRRLVLLFHRNDLLTTEQNENIFIATIKIPQLN